MLAHFAFHVAGRRASRNDAASDWPYGSGGAGSPHQLYAEMFKTMTGTEMTHVPYKGQRSVE